MTVVDGALGLEEEGLLGRELRTMEEEENVRSALRGSESKRIITTAYL